MKKQILSEEFRKMQKLAGINENEYQESSDEISITSEVKAFIDKVINDAKRDDEFEYLKDVDFFDNDLIDLIMDEFSDDGDYNDVSQEVKDYITNSITEGELDESQLNKSTDPSRMLELIEMYVDNYSDEGMSAEAALKKIDELLQGKLDGYDKAFMAGEEDQY
jgi:hypothetical protein